mgnify:CR=1 FL=1
MQTQLRLSITETRLLAEANGTALTSLDPSPTTSGTRAGFPPLPQAYNGRISLDGEGLARLEPFEAGEANALLAHVAANAPVRVRVDEEAARGAITFDLEVDPGALGLLERGDHAAGEERANIDQLFGLIEACGLKGRARGAAQVSVKHANFIVNEGGMARASDIEALIAHAKSTVQARFGVELVPEVRIVGEAK